MHQLLSKHLHGRKHRQALVEDASATTSATSSHGGPTEPYAPPTETSTSPQNAPQAAVGPLDHMPITHDLSAGPLGGQTIPSAVHTRLPQAGVLEAHTVSGSVFPNDPPVSPSGSRMAPSVDLSHNHPAGPLGGQTAPSTVLGSSVSAGAIGIQTVPGTILTNDLPADPLGGQTAPSTAIDSNHPAGGYASSAAPVSIYPNDFPEGPFGRRIYPAAASTHNLIAGSHVDQAILAGDSVLVRDRQIGPLDHKTLAGDIHTTDISAGPLGGQAIPATVQTSADRSVSTLRHSQTKETLYEDAREELNPETTTSISPQLRKSKSVARLPRLGDEPVQPTAMEAGPKPSGRMASQHAGTISSLTGLLVSTAPRMTIDSSPTSTSKPVSVPHALPPPPPPASMNPGLEVIASSQNDLSPAPVGSHSIEKPVELVQRANATTPLTTSNACKLKETTDSGDLPAKQPTESSQQQSMAMFSYAHDGSVSTNAKPLFDSEAAFKTSPAKSAAQLGATDQSQATGHVRDVSDTHDVSAWAAERAFASSPASKSIPTSPRKSSLHMAQGDSTPPSTEHEDENNPTAVDIVRYRQDFGVNLGGCFVLEKWLFKSAFPSDTPAGQTSELSAVTLWVKRLGVEETRQRFEKRWAEIMNEDDWNWLSRVAKANSIRLPIGYFTLGPKFCKNTPFEAYGGVYLNSWNIVKRFISKARSHGISVLVDLHALPGGQNPADHSGTNLGKADFWTHPANLNLGTACVQFLARELKDVDNVRGIQICNEPTWHVPGLYDWYTSVLAEVAKIDATMPIYVSDAWDLTTAVNWIKMKNSTQPGPNAPTNPVVVDTHQYFCFDKANKSLPPSAIIQSLHASLGALNAQKGSLIPRGACAAIIGEWCIRLDEASWSLHPNEVGKRATKRLFGTSQCDLYEETTGGSYFWTLKMDWLPGGDWGFMQQIQDQRVGSPTYMALSTDYVRQRLETADAQAGDQITKTYNTHVQYWNRAAPGKKLRPDLFKKGLQLGWSDARSFFSARVNSVIPGPNIGGDKIGFKELWARKRICEIKDISAEYLWEFEHGLQEGMRDFEQIAFA